MASVAEKENNDSDLRVQSPRPGTPEPSSRQGRRNTQPDTQLLDDDGTMSEKVILPFSLLRGVILYVVSSSKHVLNTFLRSIVHPHLSTQLMEDSLFSHHLKAHTSPQVALIFGLATPMVLRFHRRQRMS